MDNKETFNYTYSAKEQEEIRAIRKKYEVLEEKEDKITSLRRLDAAVTQKATMLSLISGIAGALILGFGMSLIMTDLGNAIGLNKIAATVMGVIIGIIGIFPICAAYPLYNRTVKKERERIAPEIIRLTDELIK